MVMALSVLDVVIESSGGDGGGVPYLTIGILYTCMKQIEN